VKGCVLPQAVQLENANSCCRRSTSSEYFIITFLCSSLTLHCCFHTVLTSSFCSPAAEIVRWGLFEAQFGPEVAAELDIFAGEYGEKRQADLKLRVTEHNLLTVARYYTRITTARLAELLDLTPDQVGLGCEFCPKVLTFQCS
jgi:hypothetical protein